MKSIQSPQELKNILSKNNSDIILLDVRTQSEYQSGHINSAINFDISITDLIPKIESLDKSKTYILYCQSGSRSQLASILMNQKGLDVINCQFGYSSFEE